MIHPLIGHDEARTALARSHAAGTLPAALLVMGPRGIGKQRLGLWLAQMVLCRDAGPEGGCGECRHCRRALKLEHPDLHWYFPLPRPGSVSRDKLQDALEEARNQRLAELRAEPLQPSWQEEATAIYLAAARSLRKRAGSPPAEGGEQVFIIADAESLVPQESSPEAANALLKLLEEPPPHTRFILTSSEPGRLLDTIRSRTVPLHLAPIPGERATRFLVERGTPESEADRAVRLSGGSIGMALGFLETGGEIGPLEKLRRDSLLLLRAGLSTHPGDGYGLALGYKPAGARALVPLLDFLDIWLRDLAAVASGVGEEAVNQDSVEFLARMVRERDLHPAAVAQAIPVVERARREARGNVNPQLIVAGMTTRLQQALLSSVLAPS